MNSIVELFKTNKPVIGMVHLGPLPGNYDYIDNETYQETIKNAIIDAKTLESAGIHGLIIENAASSPYLINDDVEIIDVVCMTHIASLITKEVKIPVGINVCSNAAKQSISICKATGASFIRATGWANGYYNSNGYVSPSHPNALKYKKYIDAKDVVVMADVKVKNGSHFILNDKTIKEMVADNFSAKADAVIITGVSTGVKPNINELKELQGGTNGPIVMGSGTTTENLKDFMPYVDAFIVGTYFKENRKMSEPVLYNKVKEFMDEWHRLMEE